MKFAKSRRGGSGKRAFGSANSESDDSDQEAGLEQYVKRKTAKIAENLPTAAPVPELDYNSRESEELKKKPTNSKLIEKFRAAKEQRNLDKLYNEALKADLQSHNLDSSGNHQSYVTEGYKEKKEALKQASKEREREEEQEKSKTGFLGSVSSLNVFLINTAESADQKDESLEKLDKGPKQESNTEPKETYQNDIYVGNTTNKQEGSESTGRGSPVILQQSSHFGRESVVAKFLASKRTAEEIEHQRQLYLGRMAIKSGSTSQLGLTHHPTVT
ncbi:LAFA_0C09120g1_1 [Lachancea sp. 'fantastica']|nr:LAFA_0C09120g1_1 [Lachancea sp. 'fantastica']